MGVRDFAEAVSDSDGQARLVINEKYRDAWAKVMVEADNYPKQSFLVELAAEKPSTLVELQPPGVETPAAQPAVESPVPAGESPALAHETASTNTPVAGITSDNAKEAAGTENVSLPPRPLAGIPPAERANYYQARPEMTVDTGHNYRAIIQTNKGDIVVSLNAQAAPEHVNNFIFLSNQGFYDGLTFHRVEPGFVIQGGDPLGSGQGEPGYTIPGEFSLTHGEGALAMARLPDEVNPNRESSGSQFYITLAPTPFLDGQYSVFGQVEAGMDVVQSIAVGDVIERITIEGQ